MKLASGQASLLLLPPRPVLGGERVGVAGALARQHTTAVLESRPGDPLRAAEAVLLGGWEEIPPNVLVVGEDLATQLDLADHVPWQLRTDGFVRVRAVEIELELTEERPLDHLVAELNRGGDLVGRALLVRGGAAASLAVNGNQFRVRRLSPEPPPGEAIYETTAETRFSLFAPAIRSSVDVVVLADCSGSMSWNDIPDRADALPHEPARRSLFGLFSRPAEPPTITRMEALKRALDDLLAVRLRTPGRISRLALVAFTDRCEPRFPRGVGMAEMDDRAPPELVQQFRDAVGLLRPVNAGTNIGHAVNYAAELLDKYGLPGNDRLIVLISDGADWKPKGLEDAGELVRGVDEPVSLMEDLHQRMQIHLHALGISTEEIFWPWWKRNRGAEPAHPSAVPNHKLLEAMVEVGGGDPTRTGDATVLADYFSGLGRGVSRRLAPHASEARRPSAEESAGLRRRLGELRPERGQDQHSSRRAELCKEVVRLYHSCNELARGLVGRDLFLPSSDTVKVFATLMFEAVTSKREFAAWWGKLHQQIYEGRDIRIREDGQQYPIQTVKKTFFADPSLDLNHLRNWCSHSWLSPGSPQEQDTFDKRLQRLRRILEQMIGRVALEDDDAAGWSALQLAVLTRLGSVLSAVLEALRAEGTRGPAAPRRGAAPALEIRFIP